jgi:hypothetical protein
MHEISVTANQLNHLVNYSCKYFECSPYQDALFSPSSSLRHGLFSRTIPQRARPTLLTQGITGHTQFNPRTHSQTGP